MIVVRTQLSRKMPVQLNSATLSNKNLGFYALTGLIFFFFLLSWFRGMNAFGETCFDYWFAIIFCISFIT